MHFIHLPFTDSDQVIPGSEPVSLFQVSTDGPQYSSGEDSGHGGPGISQVTAVKLKAGMTPQTLPNPQPQKIINIHGFT